MNHRSRIEFVFFDLGNVLLDFDHAIACRKIGRLCGRDPSVVRSHLFDSSLQKDFETGDITAEEFCDRLRAALQCQCESTALLEAASDIFQLNTAITPLVAKLKRSGVPTGVLSNTCCAHWQFVTAGRFAMLPALFDRFVLSFEARSMKPDGRIYQAAIGAAERDPSRVFFMDDRPENVAAARAAGIDAELYTGIAPLTRQLWQRGLPV